MLVIAGVTRSLLFLVSPALGYYAGFGFNLVPLCNEMEYINHSTPSFFSLIILVCQKENKYPRTDVRSKTTALCMTVKHTKRVCNIIQANGKATDCVPARQCGCTSFLVVASLPAVLTASVRPDQFWHIATSSCFPSACSGHTG